MNFDDLKLAIRRVWVHLQGTLVMNSAPCINWTPFNETGTRARKRRSKHFPLHLLLRSFDPTPLLKIVVVFANDMQYIYLKFISHNW